MIRALWAVFFGTRLDMMTTGQIEEAMKHGDLTFGEVKQIARFQWSIASQKGVI